MTRHSPKNQAIRASNGDGAEKFVKENIDAKLSDKDFFDLETPTAVIEVKSCESIVRCVNRQKNMYIMFGRFVIIPENHFKMIEYALENGKIPTYVFILHIKDKKISKTLLAEELSEEIRKRCCRMKDGKYMIVKKQCQISWKDIFYPDLESDHRY